MKVSSSKADMYGQIHPNETKESVAAALTKFNECQLRGAAKDASIECPKLLTDTMKLKFLRAEVFHVERSIKAFNKYWERRVEVFGAERAFRPLTIDRSEEPALAVGVFELLAKRHPTGRSIVVVRPNQHDASQYSMADMGRACWHVLHAALECEQTQKRGVIILFDLGGFSPAKFDRKLTQMIMKSIQGCMPIRISCIHICYPPAFVKFVVPLLMAFMHDKVKQRLKFHFAKNHEKLQLELSQYSLDATIMPVSLGGEAHTDFQKWTETRKYLLGSRSKPEITPLVSRSKPEITPLVPGY